MSLRKHLSIAVVTALTGCTSPPKPQSIGENNQAHSKAIIQDIVTQYQKRYGECQNASISLVPHLDHGRMGETVQNNIRINEKFDISLLDDITGHEMTHLCVIKTRKLSVEEGANLTGKTEIIK